jgi:GNAT superfamily N-acetyltransferase
MPDYLVKLYDLPELDTAIERLSNNGCVLRRALAPEKSLITGWVRRNFSTNWADECDVSFGNHPASCFIVTRELDRSNIPDLLGFACYNSVFKGFFGPTGTDERARGTGIGTALLLAALHAMWREGFAYAVIGSGGAAEAFYQKVLKAVTIDGSDPGAYRGLLIPLDEHEPGTAKTR